MKVGDYVRYKYENCIYIGKIDFISEVMCGLDETLEIEIDNCVEPILKEDIIKSSPNIIDLIEVGDYVNGQKVFDKLYDELNKCWYLKLEIGEVFGKYARTYQQHIKSIVTKEQFEAMEYKCE